MERRSLLFLLFSIALISTISATNITVTNNLSSGAGSFTDAIASAVDNDAISFEFEGSNEILLIGEITMKSITINGTNTLNGSRVILKQTVAGKSIMIVNTGVSVSLSNLIFDGKDGAQKLAITAANGSTLNIDKCIFRNINSGTDNGAAGRLQGVANITNTLFENNTCAGSYGGGALCIYNSADINIDKCTFIGNSSTGAANRGGGAIVARGTQSVPCNVKISNSTFLNNLSTNTGGAILASVQSSSNYTVNLTAVNCTFAGNQGNGAISALTTSKGISNIYLVNSIVLNNVDAGGAYSDLYAGLGATADPAASVLIEPHYVIYSVASESVVTTGGNCIQVADPSAANIFKELETFATDKKRPVLSVSGDQKVAMISSASIAKNAGIASLSGYNIPTVDQLGESRLATPAIGAVEFKDMVTGVGTVNNDNIQLIVKGRDVVVSGLSGESDLAIYGLSGHLLYKTTARNNAVISLEKIPGNFFIVKVQNSSVKVLLK